MPGIFLHCCRPVPSFRVLRDKLIVIIMGKHQKTTKSWMFSPFSLIPLKWGLIRSSCRFHAMPILCFPVSLFLCVNILLKMFTFTSYRCLARAFWTLSPFLWQHSSPIIIILLLRSSSIRYANTRYINYQLRNYAYTAGTC